MPDLSELLANIPDDIKRLVALGIGALMLVFPPVSTLRRLRRSLGTC